MTKKLQTPQIHTETHIKYEVHFGPKRMKDREVFYTDDEVQAQLCFQEKQHAKLYVDVFKIETQVTSTKTRLTSPE